MPKHLNVFIFFLLLLLHHANAQSENALDRETQAFITLVYPQIFSGILVESLETPIQIRAVFYLNLASYNAWANYHPTAVDIFGRDSYKRPRREHSRENKNIAIMFSLLRLYESSPQSFGGPSALPRFRELVREQGFDPSDKRLDGTPVGIGNREGIDTSKLLNLDGWNADGSLTSSDPAYALPFTDFTGYQPKNNPWVLRFPFRWQPFQETDGLGFFFRQEHVVPHAGSSLAFSQSPRDVRKRKIPFLYRHRTARVGEENKADLKKLKRNARRVFRRSAKLTEKKRLLAEFFDNKLSSFRTAENPFGVPSIGGAVRFLILDPVFDLSFDEDMAYGIASNIAAYDAIVTVWKEKRRQDAVRPSGQTMNYLFGNRKFEVWGGPNSENTNIRARDWQPYIRTMPHSEFPSATACICSTLIEHALIFSKGRDVFPLNVTIPKGSSRFYPGQVPSSDVTIPINRLSDWEKLCLESRLDAGVHFEPAIQSGKEICRGIGQVAEDLTLRILSGVPDLTWTKWLPANVDRFWED